MLLITISSLITLLIAVHVKPMVAGVHFDSRASKRYGCQLREVLAAATGQEVFYRPGDFWLHNAAYGKGE